LMKLKEDAEAIFGASFAIRWRVLPPGQTKATAKTERDHGTTRTREGKGETKAQVGS